MKIRLVIFLMLVGAMTLCFSSCKGEDDSDAQDEILERIASLEKEMANEEEEYLLALSSLRAEYEAEMAELRLSQEQNEEAIAQLHAFYQGKLEELQAQMEAQEDAISFTISGCESYPIWLCDNATNEYQTSIGQNNAACSLSYSEYLAQYFDCYAQTNTPGYSVSKKSLGRDSANQYEIYEYTFTPKHYSRTVMLSGGMNACELAAEFGIAYFIENVMTGTDDAFVWLRENVRFRIIPVLCPWSFDQAPMKYENYNGVNLNKNFDYNHSWDDYSAGGAGTKGESASGEAETQILIKWLHDNANKCDLWIDCHTDSSGIAAGENAYLHTVICSDSETVRRISLSQRAITEAYIAAGYFERGAEKTGSAAWIEAGKNYPKTLYAKEVCGIPSIMIEQYTGNPYYGGSKNLANTAADINNYVTMLRAYVLSILESEDVTITINREDLAWYVYQGVLEHGGVYTESASAPSDKTEGENLFTYGGIGGDGTINSNSARAHSVLIEVPESGVFTVSNMQGYVLIDVAVYEADGATFRQLTSYYTKTEQGENWVFCMERFQSIYPTCKYVLFTVRRVDNGVIDLDDLLDSKIIFS